MSGQIDEMTGFAVDLLLLDQILEREVRTRFDHANINLDVPGFGDDGLMPTGENLARFIFAQVQQSLGEAAQVESVRIAEDDTLSVTCSRQ